MIRFARAVFLALFVLAGFTARAALAEERIDDFASDIRIARNGTLTVAETITVNAEGDQIRHGIFRDFPTDYRDRFGNRVRVRFDVLDVERDGRPEPYTVETIANGKRVRIGSADTFVDPGEHSYRIVYETDRQIGFFPNYDELYWNVTGNRWAFVIEKAEATIHLPEGARIIQNAYYTGPEGAQGKDARVEVSGNTVSFYTTASLAPGEGLTVATGFSKGAVTPPTAAEKSADFLRENAGAGVALLGLIALAAYYFAAWYKHGRDPAKGIVVPLFAPPENLSAASVRYIDRMGYDRKSFAAALISMAVKGYLKISEEHGAYALSRTTKSEAASGLAPTESAIGRVLFNIVSRLELKNSNHVIVSRAITALSSALKREDEGTYFVVNRGWFFGGIAILVATAALAALLSDNSGPAAGVMFFIGVWTAATSHLLLQVFNAWRRVLTGPGSRIFAFFGAFFSTLFAAPFLGGLVVALFLLGQTVAPLILAALMVQGFLAVLFYRLLKAPTVMGAKVRDQIQGFRMFLVTAEKERLEILNPPQVTPEVFEKFLPYAIALDAENQWSRKFEAEAARAAAGGQQTAYTGYSPGWYSGSSFNRLGTTGFVSALGSSVAAATAAAATAPGGSSGSGGGGSSGGGGGGGGGGGW